MPQPAGRLARILDPVLALEDDLLTELKRVQRLRRALERILTGNGA